MSKDEFLNTLDRKLQVINEKERRDIIDEYRTHIEMKVADGKSEAEVIEDFGNIDELVDEILDAYKINTDRVNDSFDHKLNRFMDSMYEGFKRFIGNVTSLDVDDVVKLIFEIIMILIILAVVHIPFYMVESLGASLLRNVVGFGIGHVLAGIWRVILELAYVAVFVVVLVNVVSKRVSRFRHPEEYDRNSSVFDDFKESFNFDGKRSTTSHTSKRYTNEYGKEKKKDTMNQDYYEEQKEDIEDVMEESQTAQTMFEEEPDTKQTRDGYETYEERVRPKNPKTATDGNVSNFLYALMRIFFVLIAIPFICIIIGLSCCLGAMVVLSIQGFTLVGAYFLVIGGIIITSAFLSLLKSALWRRG